MSPPQSMPCNSVTLLISCQVTTTRRRSLRERYKFWSTIKRKPGETSTELAARIQQMTTTCDFSAIKNPLDESMRTCFICAINSEAILISPSSVREKEEKLALAKAVEIATEVEEAANNTKAQVYSMPDEVRIIHTKNPQRNHHHHYQKSPPPTKLSPCTTAR